MAFCLISHGGRRDVQRAAAEPPAVATSRLAYLAGTRGRTRGCVVLAMLALTGPVTASAETVPASSVQDVASAGDTSTWYGEARVRGLVASRFVRDEMGRALDPGIWAMSRVIAGLRREVSPGLDLDVELEGLTGFLVGQSTDLGQTASDTPFPVSREGISPLVRVLPRKLSLTWTTRLGRVTAGAQTFSWGMGMLVNDGAQDQAFGDGWTGNVVTRLSFATRPLARTCAPSLLRSLAVFTAGDFVLRDDNASVYEGDRALSAVAGVLARDGEHAFGALGAARHQRDREDPGFTPDERPTTTAYVVDVFARTGLTLGAHALSLALEGAAVRGRTTRLLSDATFGRSAALRQLGGIVRLGWQHTAGAAAHVELGYASGDNDPRDATAHTFTMHSDHNVGIVLFEQVLPLLTARSVDRASDPSLVGVPMAGIRFAVNPGAVQNAAYGNAVVRFRPRSALDVRLGYLFAVPVADVIDVYQTALQGGFPAGFGGRLYDRGSYGHEVDAQTTYELVLDRGLRARLGVEAGVLLPGTAFDGVARIRPAGGDPRALWIGRALASLVW